MDEKPEWQRMLNWVLAIWIALLFWYGMWTLIRMAF